jgi:hypothetical protein
VVLGIVHSDPLWDCMQICCVACSAAESPTLACMAASFLAALLMLQQVREPATQDICECSLSAYVITLAALFCQMHSYALLLLLSAVTADAGVIKQIEVSSKAAGGQSALLASGNPVK